jgi:hypothetical protein
MKIEDWIIGESLIDLLSGLDREILGIALPLELKTANHWRQSHFGLELLEWLRYSGEEKNGIN